MKSDNVGVPTASVMALNFFTTFRRVFQNLDSKLFGAGGVFGKGAKAHDATKTVANIR